MGRPKLLLPWSGTSIVGHLIQTWRSIGANRVCVVLAGDDADLSIELDRLGVLSADRILNPSPERGMFSSIQCASRWFASAERSAHGAIVLGDQPHLRLATVKSLVQHATEHPDDVCQPCYQGRSRHPVIIPAPLFARLAHSQANSLKEALAQCRVSLCACEDPGLDLDIDTPEDFQKAMLLVSVTGATNAQNS
jgi:molybdenum cofactor cytidylyltransferase